MNVTNVTTKNNFFIFSVIFIYIDRVFKKIGDIGDKCIKACKIKGFMINNSQVNQKLITKSFKKGTT